MTRAALVAVLVAILACFMLLGFYVAHLQDVIDDQQEYIRTSCKGE